MTFNGWKNYATWLVILSITSNDSMREYWRLRAVEIILQCESPAGCAERRSATELLADQMRNELTTGLIDAMPEDTPLAMMAGDLMVAALGEVAWQQIAESHLEESLPLVGRTVA